MKSGIDPTRIDPGFLQEITDPIGQLYEAATHDLLMSIASRLPALSLPRSMIPGGLQWQAYMLEQVGGLTDESMRILSEYSGASEMLTPDIIRSMVTRAIGVVEPELEAMVNKPGYVPRTSATVDRITSAYTSQALARQNLVNTVMLDSTRRAWQQVCADTASNVNRLLRAQETLNTEAGQTILGAKSLQQAVRSAVLKMADDGLTGFTDISGRSWSPEAYVTMDIRTTAANAARTAAMERNEEYGNHLIMVSSHPGARPRCEPFQGRVYSTDGTAGTAYDQHGAALEYIPLEATSYGEPAGLFGINCGHFAYPFVSHQSVLRTATVDHDENTRLYQESQQQRYMERKVRAFRQRADLLKAAGDDEGAKEMRRRARIANAELQDWCDEKKRMYQPERTRIIRPR